MTNDYFLSTFDTLKIAPVFNYRKIMFIFEVNKSIGN